MVDIVYLLGAGRGGKGFSEAYAERITRSGFHVCDRDHTEALRVPRGSKADTDGIPESGISFCRFLQLDARMDTTFVTNE